MGLMNWINTRITGVDADAEAARGAQLDAQLRARQGGASQGAGNDPFDLSIEQLLNVPVVRPDARQRGTDGANMQSGLSPNVGQGRTAPLKENGR